MVERCSRITLIAFACVLGLAASAQRYYFENLTVEKGLPASKVYCELQDSTGMVWLGTESGLANYDGNTVVAFSTAEGAAPNAVRSLFLDKEQRVWCGHSGGGITVVGGRRIHAVTLDGTALKNDVNGFVQDEKGGIWISTFGEGALHIADPSVDGALKPERFGAAQGLSDRLTGIKRLHDGTLVFLEAEGVMRKWDAGAKKFIPFLPQGLPEVAGITTLFQDAHGALWIGTQTSGAVRLDMRTGLATTYDISTKLPSNFVFCFSEDAAGRVWIGTWDGGIARIEPNGIQLFHKDNGTHSMSIRAIIRDREGNMLIATNEQGLDIFKGERFRSVTEDDHIVDPHVWAVMEDQEGRMWFGTDKGITILLDPHSGSGAYRNITMEQGELASDRVRCLKEDGQGHVWIGTETGGLFEFDPRTFKPNNDIEIQGIIAENKVTALEVGQPGELWVGTINGLLRYVPGTTPTILRTTDGLAGNNIIALHRDKRGTLWVGSVSSGITRVDNGQAKRVDIGHTFSPTCFVEDAEGRLWVGTEGQGIFVLNDGKLVDTYDVEHGLASNNIHSLITDGTGQVWIGTTRGLNKWRAKGEGFLSFTERSGFTGIETKPNAVCRTRSGDLWFGTANGATWVGQDKAADASIPPFIAIRGLNVNLEDRDPDQNIQLSHTERNVRIEYGSVSLSDPAAVRYQYILEGLDNEWQPLTHETGAHYPALPAGHYVFKVKAMNRAGVLSEKPAELRFRVLPPWWQSWWFYTALAALIGGSAFSYIKFRERQLRLRNLVLEQKVDERTAEVVKQSKEIEGQKVEIEELLLNILPKEISDELKEKGKATARHHDEVTVMFTDMKGFTKVAETMTPQQLVGELDECFIRFDAIVDRYGIEKIKTIGDSYMSACGVPTSDANHAVKAVMAALEVREDMRHWKTEREAKGMEPWVLRIGLHTGAVVAGVVGKRKFAYDIWGDAVNTASRMESSGEPGQVNISGATYELIKGYFICDHRGKVQAKNKGDIDMYFVRRIKPEFSVDKDGLVPNDRFRKAASLPQPEAELA